MAENIAVSPRLTTIAADDDSLLAAIAAGNAAAFSELMQRHGDRAFSLAFRITGRRGDAEDVVQDAFIQVWTRAGDWQTGRAKFSTWLYRVIVNRCLDLKRKPVSANIEAIAEPIDPAADALTLIERSQQQEALVKAIAALPERQRTAIALTYTTGLKNAAAAEVMEMSVKAFEALLVRAKRSLRAQLTGEDIGSLD
ncbi:MAG TPA: sigma-70 family RNA polymerase sigma factor [Dongiaceae bacterium]